ncbi:hypothetical protein BABINDRAFT_13721 [Babjeviella inositovora NRRL Y-12698]|uniref:Translin n=1 Tax=Babjeviella inositovora NRRL Y-12698 TaxID=984486 RepID=A0A1E3QNV7_9ASCO|nr:uncharacterized protein BABINDRAFT_13721 [Babjeviella inositovora NRRL Y-12698]ODQ79373.1 hypothetical protein BABINDRAFT_13721 [Babjeviella inositovora NRRL Y-12698]
MSDLSEIFQEIQLQINSESQIKDELNAVEDEISVALSSLKKFYLSGSLFQTQPMELHKVINSGVYADTNAKTRVIYHELLDKVTRVPRAAAASSAHKHVKERIVRRINEDAIYVLMLNRYLTRIADIFKEEVASISQPIISDTDIGLILAPEEVARILDIESVNYNDYLMCLLRLSDDLVHYCTQSIIQISIGSGTHAKFQYTLSLINAKLILFLQSGFELLDLKNDGLRRKYDALKYNLKKVNNIVYDLSLRQLLSTQVVLT